MITIFRWAYLQCKSRSFNPIFKNDWQLAYIKVDPTCQQLCRWSFKHAIQWEKILNYSNHTKKTVSLNLMKFSENSHVWIPVVLHRIVTWVHWFYVASLCLKRKTLGIFIGILILYPFAPHQYSFLLVRKYKEERVQPILIFSYF